MPNLHSQPLATQPHLAHQLFDEDGFLIDPSLWSEQLARTLAEGETLTLSCGPVRMKMGLEKIYARSGLEANTPLA